MGGGIRRLEDHRRHCKELTNTEAAAVGLGSKNSPVSKLLRQRSPAQRQEQESQWRRRALEGRGDQPTGHHRR